MPIEAMFGVFLGLAVAGLGSVFTYWFYKKEIYPQEKAHAAAYGRAAFQSRAEPAPGRKESAGYAVPEEIIFMARLLEHSRSNRTHNHYL